MSAIRQKEKWVAAVLAFFFGGFGIHKFYLGRSGAGMAYLVFFWSFIPALLALVDFIRLLAMSESAFNREYNGA